MSELADIANDRGLDEGRGRDVSDGLTQQTHAKLHPDFDSWI